ADSNCSTGSKAVTTLVEPEDNDETFVVHQTLLWMHSALFEAALSKQWKERSGKAVKLPDIQPNTFRIYLT
ncbi:hypothetical protein K469DRAFT_582036, partial [Zopfia rhizophila CBS 207.26]